MTDTPSFQAMATYLPQSSLNVSLSLTSSLPSTETSSCQCSYCTSSSYSSNGFYSSSISGYNQTYALCLERERLLKEKLEQEEKLLMLHNLQSMKNDSELDEKLKLLQEYVKMEQFKIESENRSKLDELARRSARGLTFNYLKMDESLFKNDFYTRFNGEWRPEEPKLSVVQASRKNSCYQNSIDILTNELYTKQARREYALK